MPDSTGRNMSRRSFLRLGAGAASGAISADLIGLGIDTRGVQARALSVPIKNGKVVPGLCPCCSVGCGQIVTVDPSTTKILDIQLLRPCSL